MAHVCEQLAQGCYVKVERPEVEPATFCVASQHPNRYTTMPHLPPLKIVICSRVIVALASNRRLTLTTS